MIRVAKSFQKSVFSLLFLCMPLSLAYGKQASPGHVPLAFAISGGISLGSYEAGLNWAIVKYSKILRNNPALAGDNRPPDLVAVTGASAGGINALVTAISWCIDDGYDRDTVKANLFRDIWLGVGFDTLLPKGRHNEGYQNTDGLFSRNAFNRVIDNIKTILDKNIFIQNCDVPVAVTTTRTIPLTQKVIEGIEVQNQRFVVPFRLVSAQDGSGGLKIIAYSADDNKKFGNILQLPFEAQNNPQIDKNNVIKAVLASSAFPVAFGRVNLDYCLDNAYVEDKSQLNPSPLCSPDSSFMNSDFVDGGVFDNVPLGLAKLLASDDDQHRQVYNYIYLDPSSRRLAKTEKNSRTEKRNQTDKNQAYGLKNQLSFFGGAIATAESYELYSVLRSGDWEKDRPRKILLSSRYPAITGMYLGHFGAFLDDGFRQYDYYAGVYDAVHDLARYYCKPYKHQKDLYSLCLGNTGHRVYQLLEIEKDPQAKDIFRILANGEHNKAQPETSWQWAWEMSPAENKSNGIIVAEKMSALRSDDGEEPELRKFIMAIADDYDREQASEELKRILENKYKSSGSWFYPVASRISMRLFDLEKHDPDSSFQGLLGMTSFGIESALADKKKFEWNQSTALNPYYRIIPYEISAGIGGTGMNLSWESRYRISESRRVDLRLKYSPFSSQRTDTDRIWFAQLDLTVSKNFSSMIMAGIGPTVSRTYDDFAGFEKQVTGAAAYLSLTDKLRFTLGKRSFNNDFAGGDLYFYISITDLPGFVYWIKQSF